MPEETRGASGACAKCSCDLAQDQAVCLWDGKEYCRACVNSVSPMLLAYAKIYSILSERIVIHPRDAVRDELLLWCLVGPAFTGFLCYVGFTNGLGIWNGIFLGVVVTALGALVRSLIVYRAAALVSGRVEVEDGRLRVQHPGRGNASWALQDCQWHVGSARKAKTFFPGLFVSRRLIIVECPLNVRFLWRLNARVPCGLTKELREVWESFLIIAGVERKRRFLR
jgi:hypothetical protein